MPGEPNVFVSSALLGTRLQIHQCGGRDTSGYRAGRRFTTTNRSFPLPAAFPSFAGWRKCWLHLKPLADRSNSRSLVSNVRVENDRGLGQGHDQRFCREEWRHRGSYAAQYGTDDRRLFRTAWQYDLRPTSANMCALKDAEGHGNGVVQIVKYGLVDYSGGMPGFLRTT